MSDTAETRMSATQFRTFQADRPDHERWELIDGTPILMPPAYLDHNRIASNLERLLNDALERHDPSREAVQRIGIEPGVNEVTLARLGLNQDYRPEPDLVVVDRLPHPDRRLAYSAYVIAEVVSDNDCNPISTGRRWLDVKELLYSLHPWAEAILEIEVDRIEVRLLVKDIEWWVHDTLSELDAELVLPRVGLRCPLRDIYARTSLCPGPKQGPSSRS